MIKVVRVAQHGAVGGGGDIGDVGGIGVVDKGRNHLEGELNRSDSIDC